MAEHRIYHSPYPAPYIPTNLSISQFLLQTNPDDVINEKPILCDFDESGVSLTYGGLRKAAAQCATGLKHAMGMQVGDTVCIYGYNSVNWALLAHSVWWGGATISAINPVATAFELSHYLKVAKPNLIAVDEALLPKARHALQQLGDRLNPRIFIIGGSKQLEDNSLQRFPLDFQNETREVLPPFDLSAKDSRKVPACMIFSSGTSGQSKGVVLSHYNIIAQLLGLRATNPFMHNGHMREVFYPSFAHIYGIVAGVALPAWVGSFVVAMKHYDFIAYIQRCSDIKSTVLRLVPATAIRLTKDPQIRKLDLSHVKTVMCSGASLPTETVDDLRRILDPSTVVLNGYGMSEATIALQRETRLDKPGTVGKLQSGVSARVIDDDGKDVAPGMDGEIIVRGPTVFMHYEANPQETKAAFLGPWMKTGDIVRCDEDGFFWIVGRKKELIKYKGNQIAPAEIEGVLLSHPLVSEAGVCGTVDEATNTEVPAACVVLKTQTHGKRQQEDLQDIQRYVEERVSPYKRLRGGLFAMDSLPKGSTGKLLRRALPGEIKKLRQFQSKL